MDRHRLVCKAFQVQGYPHAVGGGTAKIAVQLHGASLIFRESSLGNGKETFSGVPSSVRTDMAPSSFRRATTCPTSRSEERRVGTECGSTCRSSCSQYQ